jgi:hypothetical protein
VVAGTPVRPDNSPIDNNDGVTGEATSAAAASEQAGLLTEAGFEHLRTEMLDLDPPAACVLGHLTPADDTEAAARDRRDAQEAEDSKMGA